MQDSKYYDPSKWFIHKVGGVWLIYPPYQASPMAKFWCFDNLVNYTHSELFKHQVRNKDWRPAW
ncbi:hypothetical protein HOT81_gp014 [Gordonia phage Fryberger]|uniref:Uncharacterized protein n=1 Tax=Gordonia phage Fryberger TaxID=2250392 RepID=A0A346FCG9_9CAUD|nr:hypothetical protein HOT81_gp014 [Gordonia phage Fryberger]AXN53433.1 hypothetical protein SEA_FRYBERGER_14 [Gordonia phage Fryberger]